MPPQQRISDTRLGELVLRLLPEPLYYSAAFLYPVASALAGLGAVWAPAAVQFIASLPLVKVRLL